MLVSPDRRTNLRRDLVSSMRIPLTESLKLQLCFYLEAETCVVVLDGYNIPSFNGDFLV